MTERRHGRSEGKSEGRSERSRERATERGSGAREERWRKADMRKGNFNGGTLRRKLVCIQYTTHIATQNAAMDCVHTWETERSRVTI